MRKNFLVIAVVSFILLILVVNAIGVNSDEGMTRHQNSGFNELNGSADKDSLDHGSGDRQNNENGGLDKTKQNKSSGPATAGFGVYLQIAG